MNGIKVDLEVFRKLKVEDKLDVLFESIERWNDRVECIEKRGTRDKSFAGMMGFIGGAVTQLLQRNIF